MTTKTYAEVKWTVEDVLELKPEWTEKNAKAFLEHNEKYIQEGIIQCGWEVIESLL
jgi:hypothetical protein